MPVETRKRPVPGTMTERDARVPICFECLCRIGDTGLCSYGCGWDAEPLSSRKYYAALYKVTEQFVRDEIVDNSSGSPMSR